MRNSELLTKAAAAYGYDDVFNMLEDTVFDSVMSTAPGICECGYTTEVEPDGDGWCENCNKPSCHSVLKLASII